MRIAFVIMGRTPGLKQARNRLSRTTNREFATDFYNHSLNATRDLVLEVTKNNSDIELVWAVEEKEGLRSDYWKGHRTVYQGDGGLGDRLDKVYKTLLKDYDAVFLMQPNSAQLPAEIFEYDTLNFLTSDYDFLLGRTDKGDFYLFGGSSKIPLNAWIDVSYYCESTYSELNSSIARFGKVLEITESFGVLEKKDLDSYKEIPTDGMLESQEKLHELVMQTKFKDRFADLVRL